MLTLHLINARSQFPDLLFELRNFGLHIDGYVCLDNGPYYCSPGFIWHCEPGIYLSYSSCSRKHTCEHSMSTTTPHVA
jgi:hypothetical protein